MKHLFVINPVAGAKDSSEKIINDVKKKFSNEEYDIYLTEKEGGAITFIKEYLTKNTQETIRIYACGGDGTINEVVNGAYGCKNVEVTCYPCGSGNDFLKCFGNFRDFSNIDALSRGEAIDVDLIKFNDRYVLNIFNVGIDSKVVVKQRKMKKWPLVSGKAAYTLGLVSAFFGKICNNCRLYIDDKLIYDGKSVLCAVANGICYGGGYYCSPNAKVDDGLIDVCFVKKASHFAFLRLVGDYKKGKHLEKPKFAKYILYKTCRKVQLEFDDELPYSLDGEIGYAKKMTLEVIPRAIRFVVPPTATI